MKSSMLLFALCFFYATSTHAQQTTLDIIGPYPKPGSIEELKDFEILLSYQNTRTPEQCEIAAEEEDANIESFFGGKHALLSDAEIRFAKRKFRALTIKSGLAIYYYKKKYHRPRPYVSHSEIKPCVEFESSKAYPSGHTAISRVYARALGHFFPERAMLFLKRSNEVAENRIIGGVHHPSDIAAGKILGDSLAKNYLSKL
jgi:acid phosphatase (class A)